MLFGHMARRLFAACGGLTRGRADDHRARAHSPETCTDIAPARAGACRSRRPSSQYTSAASRTSSETGPCPVSAGRAAPTTMPRPGRSETRLKPCRYLKDPSTTASKKLARISRAISTLTSTLTSATLHWATAHTPPIQTGLKNQPTLAHSPFLLDYLTAHTISLRIA